MEPNKRTSQMAVASLVLGLITIPAVFCCVGYMTGMLSVIFGVIGLVAVSNNEAGGASKALAWGGITTSVLSMGGYAVLYFTVLGSTMYGVQGM